MRAALLDLLRDDLQTAGYRVDELSALWGADVAEALQRENALPARRRTAALFREAERTGTDAPSAAVLAELFLLAATVSPRQLEAALPTLHVAGAVELGLVELEGTASGGGSIRALLDLRPYAFSDTRGEEEWWILSDLGELARGGALPEAHVLGIGGASTTLSGLIASAPVRTVLDLGTGCGVQAMHARRHAERVIATDISERALTLAAANARLNGIDGIEFRLGSLYEPLAGELVDQIVSNPPFVITPRDAAVPEYEYRDGGMVGDALVREVIRGAAQHLAPGGTAQMLGNWEYREGTGGDGLARVEGWLRELTEEGTPLEAWVIEREQLDPVRYAETWIRDGGTLPRTAEYDRLQEAWLADFEARGVSAIGFGYLVLRRPGETDALAAASLSTESGTAAPSLAPAQAAAPLHRTERLGHTLAPAPLGDILLASLAARRAHAGLDDAAFAAQRFQVAGDVTEERHFWPGQEDPTAMLLRQGGGLARAVPVGTASAAVIGACDGELRLDVIIDALAGLLEVDRAALAAEVVPMARELLVLGMLHPA